jgi:ADP-heptose:LPS heptosyltransferase
VSDPLIKQIEIGFRRFIINLLRKAIKRSAKLPSNIDYNNCKYLFVRQDMIGDVLISTPLFAILKKYYPSAIIDVLLSKNNHFVLINDPLIRRRWIYEKIIGSAFRMLRNIRHEKYDFTIDLLDNSSVTSTILCLISGARWTIGLDKDNAFAYDIIVPMLSRRDTHILSRIAQLLVPFGVDVTKENLAIRYYTSVESRDAVEEYISSNHLDGKEIIGINISAGSEVRFWGIHNFRMFIQMILQRFQKSAPLILYTPSHQDRAKKIAMGIDRCLLSPITKSYDEFAAFIERCRYLITPDTSAVHLASAFNIPSVVLYVQSDKELNIWEPYGTDHEALIADIDDLSVISPEKVFNAFCALHYRVAG